MVDLINITEKDNGQKAVSAKELYLGLGLSKDKFARWYPKNIQENEFFQENKDWEGLDLMSNGNKCMDFAISIEFAKHIAMMSKTEKSHEYRNYFLKCEQQLNNPLQGYLQLGEEDRAILYFQQLKETKLLESENRINAPKVDYYNLVMDSNGLAKANDLGAKFGMSSKKLNVTLKDLGIQYKQGGTWYLYSKYKEQGFTEYPETEYTPLMKWTKKGVKFVIDILVENGYTLKKEVA